MEKIPHPIPSFNLCMNEYIYLDYNVVYAIK